MSRPKVTIELSFDEAESLDFGLSDLLCWAAGYHAAIGDDEPKRNVLGVEEARRMRIKLNDALIAARRGAKEAA